MDQSRFDALAKHAWQNHTRRKLMGQMAIVPVLSAVTARLSPPAGAEAAHPGRRLQHRKEEQRRHARRRREHQRDNQRQSLGAGSGECSADRRRGDECEANCDCHGALRCGTPRNRDQRAECGQDEESRSSVCCLGQGDSCKNNDCECCGTLSCHLGRCRVRDGDYCGLGKVHHLGTCIGNGICTANNERDINCGSRCGEDASGADAESACTTTIEGGRVCVGMPFDPDGPRCTQSGNCPAGQVCVSLYYNEQAIMQCLQVCDAPA